VESRGIPDNRDHQLFTLNRDHDTCLLGNFFTRLFVPVLVLRASAAKTKTIQHVALTLALALSERQTAGTAGMVPTKMT
jgi:hypothetical protein